MRKTFKRVAIAGTAALSLLVAGPVGSAMAIDRVGCGDRDDFLRLNITHGDGLGTGVCFANAGVTAVDEGGVYSFSSGNNKVTVNYEWDGRYYTSTLDPWQGVGFPKEVTIRVYEVRIW